MIRVVIVDDQDLIRVGLRAVCARSDDLTVVGEAADGLRGVEVVRETVPDIVLMDIRMPGVDGVEATRRITDDQHLSAVRVIMLTTFDTDQHVFEALQAGASGFLLKDATPDDLRQAIRTVAEGSSILAPAVTARVVRAAVGTGSWVDPAQHPVVSTLTEREREVLALIGRGLDNTEIAAALVISPATARTYVSRLLAKVSARDRAQLVVLAHQAGLVAHR